MEGSSICVDPVRNAAITVPCMSGFSRSKAEACLRRGERGSVGDGEGGRCAFSIIRLLIIMVGFYPFFPVFSSGSDV